MGSTSDCSSFEAMTALRAREQRRVSTGLIHMPHPPLTGRRAPRGGRPGLRRFARAFAAAALLALFGALAPPAQAQTCTDNDIDLVRGKNESEGSVQICHDN